MCNCVRVPCLHVLEPISHILNVLITTTSVLTAVFQVNLDWFPLSVFVLRLFQKRTFWEKWHGFYGLDVLQSPNQQSAEGNTKHWSQPVAWLHPVFIHHRTREWRGVEASGLYASILAVRLFTDYQITLMCIQRTVGTWGLTGLDRLLCFMIVQELQNFTRFLERRVLKDKMWMDWLNKLSTELDPVSSLISECGILCEVNFI